MSSPDAPRSLIRSAALVEGWPAVAIAGLLAQREIRERIEEYPPHLRLILEDVADAIRMAGRAWVEEVRRGTPEPAAAEPLPESEVVDAIMTTAQAADVLGCSDRYIRRLLDSGDLLGRRESGHWKISTDSVLARRK